jgi:catechol 2,3-dioxygenase-like lactoylglutathione lyase family enzyme
MDVVRAIPILTVADVPASIRDYEDVTGMRLLVDRGWLATLGSADGTPMIGLMGADATATLNPQISLNVDDADDAYRLATGAGLEIVHDIRDEEWGVRRFFFRDRDGNVINVLSHARSAADPAQ